MKKIDLFVSRGLAPILFVEHPSQP